MAGNNPRGFGAMDPGKQRQIASKGGKAAHQKGTAHEFTPEEAREAGRKGGMMAHQKGTAHQFTPQEAAEAGRKGGRAAHQKAANRGTAHGHGEVPRGNGSPMTGNGAPIPATEMGGLNGEPAPISSSEQSPTANVP